MRKPVDAPRALVAAAVLQTGGNLAELSRAIGKNHAYLQQYLERGIPRVLSEDVREKLAVLLDLNPDQLRGTVPGRGAPKEAAPDAIATTDEEAKLLRLYRNLDPAARKKAIEVLKVLA
jgi:lambda repressor-like predicted transcriptional regulator